MTESEISAIYLDGRHYDRLFPTNDLPFWRALARRYGGPVLELACGTGRLAIPLAEDGHRVVGLDFSAAMLREAERKAAGREIDARWIEGDMRDFDAGGRFALVLLANNALGHLHTLDDFEACMRAVRRHLAPGGRFVIDVFVPRPDLLALTPDEERTMSEYDDPDGGGRVRVATRSKYEADTQIRRNTTFRHLPGRAEPEVGRLDLRMYFPQELRALLGYNGFTVEHAFGAFDGRPFDAASPKQILVSSVVAG